MSTPEQRALQAALSEDRQELERVVGDMEDGELERLRKAADMLDGVTRDMLGHRMSVTRCGSRIDLHHLMMGDVSVYCERETGHAGQCQTTPTLEWGD